MELNLQSLFVYKTNKIYHSPLHVIYITLILKNSSIGYQVKEMMFIFKGSYFMIQDLWYKIQISRFVFKIQKFIFISCFQVFKIHIFFKNIPKNMFIEKHLFQFKIERLFSIDLLYSITLFISFLISVLLCSCVKKSRNWKMVVYIVATIVFTK